MKWQLANKRRTLISAGLIATLLVTFYGPEPGSRGHVEAVVPAAKRSAARPASTDLVPQLRIEELGRARGLPESEQVIDIYRRGVEHPIEAGTRKSAKSEKAKPSVMQAAPAPVVVAPIAAPVVAPAPAPVTAPPLPFSYVGKFSDDNESVFFLLRGDKLYKVRVGQVIDQNYRIEGVRGNALAITYLPLDIVQTVVISEAS
jgi:hypothetical protein